MTSPAAVLAAFSGATETTCAIFGLTCSGTLGAVRIGEVATAAATAAAPAPAKIPRTRGEFRIIAGTKPTCSSCRRSRERARDRRVQVAVADSPKRFATAAGESSSAYATNALR